MSLVDRLAETVIRVSSPNGTIMLTANDRGDLTVKVDPDLLSWQSDDALGAELQACVLAALRSARREYVRALRNGVEMDPAGLDEESDYDEPA